MSELPSGTNIVVQLKPKDNWTPGIVVQKVRDRTYLVKTNNGSEYIRNRRFIKINKHVGKKERNKNHYLFNSARNEDEKEWKKCYIEIEPEDEGIGTENEPEEISSDSNLEYGTASGSESIDSDIEVGPEIADANPQNPYTTRYGRTVR